MKTSFVKLYIFIFLLKIGPKSIWRVPLGRFRPPELKTNSEPMQKYANVCQIKKEVFLTVDPLNRTYRLIKSWNNYCTGASPRCRRPPPHIPKIFGFWSYVAAGRPGIPPKWCHGVWHHFPDQGRPFLEPNFFDHFRHPLRCQHFPL